jgi:hypothetical protein
VASGESRDEMEMAKVAGNACGMATHAMCSTNLGSDAESQCPTLGVMLDIRMASTIVSTTISGAGRNQKQFFSGGKGAFETSCPLFWLWPFLSVPPLPPC